MADRIFNLPIDQGYVFYNKENGSVFYHNDDGESRGYWEAVRKHGAKDLTKEFKFYEKNLFNENFKSKMLEYAKALKNMAEVERKKENELLQTLEPGSDFSFENKSGREFLKDFNKIIMGEDEFLSLLDRLIDHMDARDQDNGQGKKKKNRAPSQAANANNYLISAIVESFYGLDAQESLRILSNGAAFDAFFKEVILDKFMKKMLVDFEDTRVGFGNAFEYAEAYRNIERNEFFKFITKQFAQTLLISRIEIENALLKGEGIILNKEGATKEKIKKSIKRSLDQEYKEKNGGENSKYNLFEELSRRVGGFVEEFLREADLRGKLEWKLDKNYGQSKISGGKIKSNIGAVDMGTVFSKDIKLNTDKIFEELDENLTPNSMSTRKQENIAYKLNEFYRKYSRKKYSELFIIHSSAKLYSLGENFRGFTKKAHIQDIIQMLNKSKILVNSDRFGKMLTSFYYNTIPGACLDEYRDELREILRVVVAAYAGNLLFADWFMLGKEVEVGANQIHIFNLDGVYVPLSYIIEGLSQAMKNYGEGKNEYEGANSSYIQVTLSTKPKNIKYPAGQDPRYPGLFKNGSIHFMDFWNAQRQEARLQSVAQIKFLTDFKSIIRQIREDFNNI